MLTLCMMGTLPTQAQFGKLLDKVKGKSSAGKNQEVSPPLGNQNLITKRHAWLLPTPMERTLLEPMIIRQLF